MAGLAKTGALSTINVMYGAVAAFAATLVVSHWLGDDGAGEFFKVVAMFAIGTSVAVFGADTALVRTVSAARALDKAPSIPQLLRFAFPPVLIISVVLTALTFVVTLPQITPSMADDARLIYRVSAPFLVFSSAMTVLFGALRGLGFITRYTFAQNVLLPTLRILAVIAALSLSATALYLSLAWAIPLLLVFALTWYWVRKLVAREISRTNVAESSSNPVETRKSFWGFASARGFSAMVEQILEWVDVLLVTSFLGLAAGGIYGAVNRCVRIGVLVEHTGRIVTGPSISGALATDDKNAATKLFTATTRVLILAAWPFYLTLAFFGSPILSFFGDNFDTAAIVLWVICPAIMASMAAGGVQSVLLMSGKSRWQLYNKCSALVVALVLNFTLIPRWGLLGAATAWAASVLTDTLLASWQVTFGIGIRAKLTEMLPAVLVAFVIPAGGALAVTHFLGTGITALLVHSFAILPLYVLIVFIFRQPIGIAVFLKRRRKTSSSPSPAHQPENLVSRKAPRSMGKTPRRRATSHSASNSTSVSGGQPVSFRSQVRKVTRHPLIIAACGLLGAGALGGYSFLQAPEYQATSTILVYALPTDPLSSATSTLKVDIDTETAVADSSEVAQKAAEKLSMNEDGDVQKILNSVKAKGHSQTSILDITATAKSPENAAARANAVAEAYLQVREDSAADDVKKAAQNIQDDIDALSKNSSENQATISELRQQLAHVQVASTNAGRVVTSATEPASASGLGFPVYAGVGLVGGLLIGIPVAYLVDHRKRRLGYPDRAEEITGAPISVVGSANVSEDLRLVLRRAGISDIQQPTDEYRGLAVYSPHQQVTDALTQSLQHIVADFKNVAFVSASEGTDTDGPLRIYPLASGTALPEMLDAADDLGYCLLAFTADTAIEDVARIHREVVASSATFIPIFITQ